MSLLLTMLPLYLFGNLHCIGMCGPLVMMLGQHRYRHYYFLGRLTSFSLAGFIAGELGTVLHLILKQYYLAAFASFAFGAIILIAGAYSLLGWQYPGHDWLAKRLMRVHKTLSLLMLRDQAWPSFLFGFFTIALPCGQTLIVFSACALAADATVGLLNGFAFALLTSPSLWLAMHAHIALRQLKVHHNKIIGACALVISMLAFCRGLADMDLIDHWILNPNAPAEYHIVLY